jgi:hypothetical protein
MNRIWKGLTKGENRDILKLIDHCLTNELYTDGRKIKDARWAPDSTTISALILPFFICAHL